MSAAEVPFPEILAEQEEHERALLIEWGVDPDRLDDPVDRAAAIDGLMAEIAMLRRQREEEEQIAERRIEMIRNWQRGRDEPRERRIRSLEAYAQDLFAELPTHGAKSRTLPHGTIGYRKVSPRIEVEDPTEAVRFAKVERIPVKETPMVSELKAFWKATGRLPAGCRKVPGEDRFYISII